MLEAARSDMRYESEIWLKRNGQTPRNFIERVSASHLYAIHSYTGGDSRLINTASMSTRWADAVHLAPDMARVAVREVLRDIVDGELSKSEKLNASDSLMKRAPVMLKSDKRIADLMAEYLQGYRNLQARQREEPAPLDSVLDAWRLEMRGKLRQRVEEILPDVVAEARLHADMLNAALNALPRVKDVTVWRGNWATGGDSLISPFLKMLPAGYNAQVIVSEGFTSTSRKNSVAMKYMRRQPMTAVRHPVLLQLRLSGVSGRDIALFGSTLKDEVMLLPGARFRVTSRSWADGYELIEAVEENPGLVEGLSGSSSLVVPGSLKQTHQHGEEHGSSEAVTAIGSAGFEFESPGAVDTGTGPDTAPVALVEPDAAPEQSLADRMTTVLLGAEPVVGSSSVVPSNDVPVGEGASAGESVSEADAH
jgi:hypothetical protein